MGATNHEGPKPGSAGVLAHIKQAAVTLGLSQYQVQNLIDEGRLPAERIGGRTYVKVEDLHSFIADFGKSA